MRLGFWNPRSVPSTPSFHSGSLPTRRIARQPLARKKLQKYRTTCGNSGHRFSNPFTSDGSVHFIPRGHNTVASPNRRPLYCHGGATPEEVIIPSGVFRLFRASWVEPNVRFVDLKQRDGKAAFYVKRITNVAVEIQNPNFDDCRLESITMDPPVGEIRDFGRVAVGAKDVGRITMSLYFATGATAVRKITFNFAFRVAQEPLVRRVELPVVISSAASGGTDLTSLS